MDDSGHAHGEPMDSGATPADADYGDDVKIEQVSDSRLRVTVGRIATEVTVERVYRTPRSFGEFHSLDHLVAFLRKKSEDEGD